IKEHLKFESGALVYLVKGKSVGETGKIEEIKGKSIVLKKSSGEKQETKKVLHLLLLAMFVQNLTCVGENPTKWAVCPENYLILIH
ncbi:hypothetical protein KKF86_09560, partial [bacterium]|nr:hypothetical protein [bacterium]